MLKASEQRGYDVKSSIELSKVLEKTKESIDVPVVISVNIDYSRNRILLDDDFNG
ncbi:MAG: hypothetical protein WBF33_39435 [Candidatus Nitrosopolaris sp.]